MLSMFPLARNLSVRTWYQHAFHMGALCTLVQKQAIATSSAATGSSKTKATKISASKKTTTSQLIDTSSINASTEIKQLDTRSPQRSKKKFLWTEEKDAVLREGIAKHRKDGWAKVADFVGGGASAIQCCRRGIVLQGLANEGVKRGAWDPEEMRRLEELVPQYLVHPYWSTQYKKMTEEYTDWKGIGKELGRLPHDCNNKWRRLQCAKMKKGHFTAEEDALIRQRVAEWKGDGPGLWIGLEKEMGRAAEAILGRWNKLTSVFLQTDTVFYWTDEMDEKLRKCVSLHKRDGWAKVAEHVGGAASESQCRHRWGKYLQHKHVKRGAWDQDEVERLTELVPQHVVPSYWSEWYKRMTKERIDWAKIAAELGRLPIDCTGKWRLLQYATMKTGPFTDSEIATIRERVAGWDVAKTKGLWMGLQKDLGRSASSIRSHWVCVSGTSKE